MAISWVCWVLPLVAVLVQASHPDFLDHMFPRPKGRSAISRMIMEQYWKSMYEESIHNYHKAMQFLNNEYNTTFIPIKGEATHIMMQTAVGNLYNISIPVTEAKCPEDHTPGKYDGCEPLPGAQKKLCLVAMLVLPGNQAPFYHHEPCQDLTPYLETKSPPAEETEEEGTPYM